MMNYSYNANVYDIFADMLIYDRCFIEPKQQYCIGYAGRRDGLKYKHHSQQIRMKFKDQLISHEIVPDALAAAMGNQVYLLRAKNEKEIQEMIKYVLEKRIRFESFFIVHEQLINIFINSLLCYNKHTKEVIVMKKKVSSMHAYHDAYNNRLFK